MATYPLAFPAKAPFSETLRIGRQQAVMESPHTLHQQAINNADHWLLEWTWAPLHIREAEAIQAWMDSLVGQIGTFTYRPVNALQSTLQGHSLALGAYSYANSISVQGWSAGQASTLYRGQYIQVGQRLHRITDAPANADGDGRCLIEVQPMIRTSMAAGTAVEFRNPLGTFRMASSEGVAYTLNPDRRPSFPTIQAKEAL